MKNFIVFVILLIAFLISLPKMHYFMKTRNGVRFGTFQSETALNLSPILRNYLDNAHITYYLYKLPNYVIDFLKYDKEFSTIYKNDKKATIIIFSQDRKQENASTGLYSNAQNLQKKYAAVYNLIIRDENLPPKYIQEYDNIAYKDFREYCSGFCILNPSNNTMFTFKRITNTETEALEAIFQQLK